MVRPIEADELVQFFEAMSGPFAFDLPDEGDERDEWLERIDGLFEPDRTRCAFDSGRMVGTLGAFSFDMTVPGGRQPCAGTTMVTVQTSHRRRGLLRQMMDAHLDEAQERGDSLAALWASDSAIYRRFAFGVAAVDTTIEFARNHVAFGRLAPEPSEIVIISAEEAEALLPPVYDRIRHRIPGCYAMSDRWWEHRLLRDAPERRGGATKYRYAITGTPEAPTGYVQFRVKEDWGAGHAAHEVRVSQLLADDPHDWAGLWRHALDHDLAGKIVANHRPEDDPVFDFVAGPRRALRKQDDGLWVRILDVAAALAGRTYLAGGTLVFSVHDPLHRADGTYELSVDQSGQAECSQTSRNPELEIDLEDLSSAYLGRTRISALHRAGRVSGDPAAAGLADRMFGWDRAAWCPEVF